MRGRGGQDPLQREADIELQLAQRAQDQHERERQILFENEALALKVLQAVSGASMIGALAQADTLIRFAGRTSFFAFLTALGVALLAAVFAVHWKHQYKMYQVKAATSHDQQERETRYGFSGSYLTAMRAGMWVALLFMAGGFIQLLICFWVIGAKA